MIRITFEFEGRPFSFEAPDAGSLAAALVNWARERGLPEREAMAAIMEAVENYEPVAP